MGIHLRCTCTALYCTPTENLILVARSDYFKSETCILYNVVFGRRADTPSRYTLTPHSIHFHTTQ